MDVNQIGSLIRSAEKLIGSWWQDDRRNWCAYCGIPMRQRKPKGTPAPNSMATRDHIVPKAHKGGLLTLPACRECNAAKGRLSLPEFIESEYFSAKRAKRHRHQWPIADLWFVVALASLKKSNSVSPDVNSSSDPAAPSGTKAVIPPTKATAA